MCRCSSNGRPCNNVCPVSQCMGPCDNSGPLMQCDTNQGICAMHKVTRHGCLLHDVHTDLAHRLQANHVAL
jgi:hypothetical protein